MAQSPNEDNSCSAVNIAAAVGAHTHDAMVHGANIGAEFGVITYDKMNQVATNLGVVFPPQRDIQANPAEARAAIDYWGAEYAAFLGHDVIDPHTSKSKETLNPGGILGAPYGAVIAGAIAAAGEVSSSTVWMT